MNEYKEIFSNNLIALRKSRKLTQSELAEYLKYSDKTISKWENGDAMPDVETLLLISDFFEVSTDDLLKKPYQEVVPNNIKKKNNDKWNKTIITLLSLSLVWLTATIIFVQVKIISNFNIWITFVWAIPISFIVLLIFNSIWGKRTINFIIISFLVWTMLLSMHLQILTFGKNTWPIYFLGLPLQVATILWSQLKSSKK